jgi:hypothetical protein
MYLYLYYAPLYTAIESPRTTDILLLLPHNSKYENSLQSPFHEWTQVLNHTIYRIPAYPLHGGYGLNLTLALHHEHWVDEVRLGG